MLLKGCTACYDLTFGCPLASVEELNAIGQAYLDAGMRAVVAPMLADMSFYQAIPGLLEALPATGCRRRVLRRRPAGADLVRADARRAARLAARPRAGPARDRADHPAPLLRRADHRLGPACARVRRGAADPCGGIQGAGGLGAQALGQVADRAYRRARPARADFTVAHGVWLDDDDMRRLADHGVVGRAQSGSNMRLGSASPMRGACSSSASTLGIGTDSAHARTT